MAIAGSALDGPKEKPYGQHVKVNDRTQEAQPPDYAWDLDAAFSDDDDEPLEGLQGFENVLVRPLLPS